MRVKPDREQRLKTQYPTPWVKQRVLIDISQKLLHTAENSLQLFFLNAEKKTQKKPEGLGNELFKSMTVNRLLKS